MFYNTARKLGLKSGDDKETIKRMYISCVQLVTDRSKAGHAIIQIS